MNPIIERIRRHKILTTIAVVLLLLILTNPSPSAFKNYLGYTSYKGLQRKYNFYVFSIYQDGNSPFYYGVVGNFFKENNEENQATTDTTWRVPAPPLPKGFTPKKK